MAVADALKMLKSKAVLGEYGTFTRPYVVLDITEYEQLLVALSQERPKRGRPAKVPHEAVR